MDFFEAQARAKKRTSRLVALFVLAVGGIIVAGYFATVLFIESRGATDEFTGWHPRLFAGITAGTLAVVGFASLFKWLQLRAGGRAVAEMVGAREIPPQTADLRERQLLNVVEEMSIAAGLPLPAVYVLDDENGINAFAAGLTTSDAVVTVTRGTLEKLNRDELQGVVAHEFSHILNGDMRLNTRLTAVLFGILVIGLIGRGIVGSLRYSRPRRDSKEGNGVFIVLAVGLVLLVLGYVGYFFGRLIQAAVSRQREFLADASAVQFTRNPAGITSALKKIGGYALGSNIQTHKASELSHFFFAQGFRSYFGGLWATHPPLDERIRAVDASFDGKYFEPPEVVDIATETWKSARRSPSPTPAAPVRSALQPIALVASIGTIDTAHVEQARDIGATFPPALREAVRAPEGAAAVVCGLLLDADASLRSRQHALIERLADAAIATTVRSLETDLLALPRESRLSLLLLCPPALRRLEPADLERVLAALDELVHADGRVSLFEFALQKVLTHHLDLAASPSGRRETYSPADVSAEISTVLSFGARIGSTDDAEVQSAFNAGAAQFSGLFPPLALRSTDLGQLTELDAALDKLALAYGPVKKRLLTALAAVVASDGQISSDEAELVRALSSALDCPMPVMAA